MKSLKNISLIILFSFFCIQPAQSQRLLKNISKKVNQKAGKRFVKEADKEANKELNNVEDDLEKEHRERADSIENFYMQNALNSMGFSTTPVPIAEEYLFNYLIQMHIEEFDKKGKKKSEGEFISHVNSDSKCLAYQSIDGDMAKDNQGLIIMDFEHEATIILSEEGDEKTGIVYGIKGFMDSMGESYELEELEDSPETYLANPNIKKTGRKKTIAGYVCEEFVYSDDISESNIWITEDLKIKSNDLFSALYKTNLYSHGMPWGYTMEITTKDKSNGEKSTMQVIKVDPESNVNFSVSDYEITNLGSFQPPAEK